MCRRKNLIAICLLETENLLVSYSGCNHNRSLIGKTCVAFKQIRYGLQDENKILLANNFINWLFQCISDIKKPIWLIISVFYQNGNQWTLPKSSARWLSLWQQDTSTRKTIYQSSLSRKHGDGGMLQHEGFLSKIIILWHLDNRI